MHQSERAFAWMHIPFFTPVGTNLRLRAEFKRVATTRILSVNLGGWSWTPESPTPSWTALKRAKFWKSTKPKLVAMRERLMAKPPTFTVVDMGEGSVKVMKLESGGVTQSYTVYKTTGDASHPTGIPEGHEAHEFRAALLDADLGQIPYQVQMALDKLVPTLVFGSTASKVASVARELLGQRGDVLLREVTVYIRPASILPSAMTPFRVTSVALVAAPGTVCSQVCTPSLRVGRAPVLGVGSSAMSERAFALIHCHHFCGHAFPSSGSYTLLICDPPLLSFPTTSAWTNSPTPENHTQPSPAGSCSTVCRPPTAAPPLAPPSCWQPAAPGWPATCSAGSPSSTPSSTSPDHPTQSTRNCPSTAPPPLIPRPSTATGAGC